MTSPEVTKRRSWPLGLKLLLVIVGIAVTGVGTLFFLGVAATARWDRYAAKLRESGDPLTLDETEAARTEISDERNGALVILRLRDRLQQVERKSDREPVFILGKPAVRPDYFGGLPRDRIPPSRELLKTHGDLVEALSLLHDMPSGRFAIDFATNPLETLIPHLSQVRAASRLLSLAHVLSLIDGDLDRAVDLTILLSAVSGTLNESPLMIDRVAQVSMDTEVARSIEGVLRVGVLGEQQVRNLIEVVHERLNKGTLKWSLLGERAMFIQLCEGMADGEVAFSSLAPYSTSYAGPLRRLPTLPKVLIRGNQVKLTAMLTNLLESGDSSVAMLKEARTIEAQFLTRPVTDVIARIVAPSYERAFVLHFRSRAELHAAMVGLAAERFRFKTGRLPDSIDALVPQYLDAVPTDPFDGKQMRMAETDEGIVIYSVHEDLIDDGGIVARQQSRPWYPDVGFRLNRPEHRGLLLIDNPPSARGDE